MVLPISTVLTGFVNMLFSELIVFLVLIFGGIGLSVYIVVLPVVMGIQLMLVLGIVLILSALTVYFRDILHFLDIVIMAWFYATPIVYPPERIPERFLFILYLNPMAGIIDSYRKILYYRCLPDFSTMLPAAALGLASMVLGAVIFQSLQKRFAEEL